MTRNQQRAYRGTWAKAARKLADRGFSDAEIEQKRRDITLQVTRGRSDSSAAIADQREVDELFMLVFAIAHDDRIDLQVRQLEQPVCRYRWLVDVQLDHIVAQLDAADLGHEADVYRRSELSETRGREGFILFMLRRLSGDHRKVDAMDFDEAAWWKLLCSVKARLDQVRRKGEEGRRRAPARTRARSAPASRPSSFSDLPSPF